MQRAKLILLRHGQSEWNSRNLFTGWVDIPLSTVGIQEALQAGEKIKNLTIDRIHTSTLMRAIMTAMLAMSVHSTGKVPIILHKNGASDDNLEKWGKIHSEETAAQTIPVYCAWELNERMYGDLQGLNKAETMKKFGEQQVKIWRRSFDVPPPNGESLEMTAARSIPYFQKKIVPSIEKGQNVLVAAHGNSLRSIIMHLDGLSKEEVLELELPTGFPVIYEYRNNQFYKMAE